MADREPPERYAGCLATGASPAPVATSLARRITGARLACDDCKIRSQCTNGRFRTVSRLENEAVLDRMQARLAQRRVSSTGVACREAVEHLLHLVGFFELMAALAT